MQELEWMSAHPEEVEKYSGKWVAVSGDGIVAAGNSVSEVEAILKKKGVAVEKVLLTKVPRKDEEMSILLSSLTSLAPHSTCSEEGASLKTSR